MANFEFSSLSLFLKSSSPKRVYYSAFGRVTSLTFAGLFSSRLPSSLEN